MFKGLVRRSRAAFFLPLMLVACAAPTEEGKADGKEQLGTTEQGLGIVLFDPCMTQLADHTQGPSYITLANGESVVPSDDAAYAYRSGCTRFIVDTIMNPSNLHGESILLSASAFDLPSSSAIGGTMPNNALDCGKFVMWVDHYAKKGDEVFTKVVTNKFNGLWVTGNGAAHCELNRISGTAGVGEYIAKYDGSAIFTYRTTVRVELRGVAQQVAARHEKWTKPAY